MRGFLIAMNTTAAMWNFAGWPDPVSATLAGVGVMAAVWLTVDALRA